MSLEQPHYKISKGYALRGTSSTAHTIFRHSSDTQRENGLSGLQDDQRAQHALFEATGPRSNKADQMLCVPRMSPRISLKNERRGVTGRIDGVQVSKSDNMSTLQAKRPTTSLSVTRALSVPLSVRDIEPALLLVDADLWAKFHSHQNEMILTKSGRCLFPCLNFKAVNLDSKAIYTIHLDFETMDSHRFRFSSGRWSPAQPSERSGNDDFANSKSTVRSVLSQGLYMHPDLRQTGKHWMEKNMISFANVKLTNRVPEPDTQRLNGRSRENDYIQTGNHIFHLVSFHKYRPRIHLTQCSQQTRESTFSTTFTYDQTSFIAVTHYQNHRVNDLKKDHNPHAKGFRDTIGYSPSQSTKRRRMISSSSSTRSTESSLGTWSRLDKEENASDGEGQASEEFESDSMGNEGDSKRKFVHLCRQNKDDSAMVTISMARDTAQVTGHLKSSPGLIGHNQITMTTATMDTTQHKGVGSTRGNVPLFLTPEYGSIAKTRESKVVRTRGYNLGDISTSNELDRLQDVFVGTSSPLSTPQPRAARVHIDTAPASLFQVTNPMLPIPSNTNTSTDTAVELPNLSALALLNQATAECAALAEANSSAAIMPTHEAVIFDTAPSMSWYRQFSLWGEPHSNLQPPQNNPSVLGTKARQTTSAGLQSPLRLSIVQDVQREIASSEVTAQTVIPPRLRQPSSRSPLFSDTFMNAGGQAVYGVSVQDDFPIAEALSPSTELGTDLPLCPSNFEQVQTLANSRLLRSTVLESKVSPSISSVAPFSPYVMNPSQLHMEYALHENHCLRAFIRERYGQEAEADANAVVAMQPHK